jgi:uncharacterized BrkB/YihY/UPF0761 family membrane protein
MKKLKKVLIILMWGVIMYLSSFSLYVVSEVFGLEFKPDSSYILRRIGGVVFVAAISTAIYGLYVIVPYAWEEFIKWWNDEDR